MSDAVLKRQGLKRRLRDVGLYFYSGIELRCVDG